MDRKFAEYHPFTISSGTKDDNIRFTMKMLGNFTRRVRDHLTSGAEVLVEGPYGRFNPLKESNRKQVWIAGGIGITPFLSTLRSMNEKHDQKIDLFYCVREETEALYLEEMRDIASQFEGVNLHLMTSDTGGWLTADVIEEAIGEGVTQSSYYFCGPKPMLKALSAGLQAKGVKAKAIHFDEFKMR